MGESRIRWEICFLHERGRLDGSGSGWLTGGVSHSRLLLPERPGRPSQSLLSARDEPRLHLPGSQRATDNVGFPTSLSLPSLPTLRNHTLGVSGVSAPGSLSTARSDGGASAEEAGRQGMMKPPPDLGLSPARLVLSRSPVPRPGRRSSPPNGPGRGSRPLPPVKGLPPLDDPAECRSASCGGPVDVGPAQDDPIRPHHP